MNLLIKAVNMNDIAPVPKTALDVFRNLPEGTLCEVLHNTLYMSPAPRIPHQQIVSLFNRRIGTWVEQYDLGITLVAPVDVYLEPLQSAVQPDVLFIANENMSVIHHDGYIYGAPDLIVEVLSDELKRDTVLKKYLYEQALVKEYFIVDPATKHVTRYDLAGNTFKLVSEEIGRFSSALLQFDFTF